MTARRFRKKPVVVEAVRYDPPRNCEQVWRFLGWPWPQPEQHKDCYHNDEACGDGVPVYIETSAGEMECLSGDWIIKGVKGDFVSVCSPDVFAATYEPVEDDQ